MIEGEIITYNPDDPDTYPSTCMTPDDVKDRFGFTGGEKLLFTSGGAYIARLVSNVMPLEGGEQW